MPITSNASRVPHSGRANLRFIVHPRQCRITLARFAAFRANCVFFMPVLFVLFLCSRRRGDNVTRFRTMGGNIRVFGNRDVIAVLVLCRNMIWFRHTGTAFLFIWELFKKI